jgi:hypothetical protein
VLNFELVFARPHPCLLPQEKENRGPVGQRSHGDTTPQVVWILETVHKKILKSV